MPKKHSKDIDVEFCQTWHARRPKSDGGGAGSHGMKKIMIKRRMNHGCWLQNYETCQAFLHSSLVHWWLKDTISKQDIHQYIHNSLLSFCPVLRGIVCWRSLLQREQRSLIVRGSKHVVHGMEGSGENLRCFDPTEAINITRLCWSMIRSGILPGKCLRTNQCFSGNSAWFWNSIVTW